MAVPQLQLNAEALARIIQAAQAQFTITGTQIAITTPDGSSAVIETNQPILELEDTIVNR
jgi:hypothetical protein